METFRQFEAGPDPFGRTWKVEFKWLQTAISLRHSDTVDVKFVLSDGEARVEKTIAMPHVDLVALSNKTGRPMNDAWCSRIAALHLKRMVETGEDLEKDLVTLSAQELAEYDAQLHRPKKSAA
ncbi:MAG TPA: hypothetical protein VJN43_19435 [Bryobacteraceae bacterium]|nr:hypothetical protein [Bryobacteraceae bacterium]